MSSVAFLYGLGEGPLQSRQFRQQLIARGHAYTKDTSQAEILIAHSGGCLIIPPNRHASLILLIGYTDWPGRNLLYSHWRRQMYGLRTYRFLWIPMTLGNLASILRVRHTWRLAKAWSGRGKTLPRQKSVKTIFVRNRYDDFCAPNALLTSQPDNCFVSIEGGHDDCWINPDRYIDLIELELKER